MRAVAIGISASALLCASVHARAEAIPRQVDRFDAMIERPLFSPTRRPPPPPPAPLTMPSAGPVQAPPPPAPNVTLSGVISGGGGGVALLRRPQDQTPVRVASGGQIDGWTVTEIRPRAVVLRRDARSVTVELTAAAR